jgi:hypothetical protein
MDRTKIKIALPPTSPAPAPDHGAATQWIGLAPAAVSAVASLLVINWCLNLGLDFARDADLRCGTSGQYVYNVLTGGVPLALVLPYVGWYAARKTGIGVPIARCAALTAHATWLTVLLLVNNYHFW